MKYPKTTLWFVGLASIGITIGLKTEPAFGFLFFGLGVVLSFVFYYMYKGL
jgi:hypothetical protein